MPRKRKQKESPAGFYVIDDGHEVVEINDNYRIVRHGEPSDTVIAKSRLKRKLTNPPSLPAAAREAREAQAAKRAAQRSGDRRTGPGGSRSQGSTLGGN